MKLRRMITAAALSTGMLTACLAILSGPAFAGSADTTFNVTASVAGSCTISATNVDLGAYDPASGSNATGTITYQCTPGLSPSISLDGGLNSSGNPNGREMAGSPGFLTYNIYQDDSDTTLWGDGTEGSTEAATADGNSDTATAYVNAPSGQTSAPAGNYTDTVTATINW